MRLPESIYLSSRQTKLADSDVEEIATLGVIIFFISVADARSVHTPHSAEILAEYSKVYLGFSRSPTHTHILLHITSRGHMCERDRKRRIARTPKAIKQTQNAVHESEIRYIFRAGFHLSSYKIF